MFTEHRTPLVFSMTGVVSRCHAIHSLKAELQMSNANSNSHLQYCALIRCTTTKTNISELVLQTKIFHHIGNLSMHSSMTEVFTIVILFEINYCMFPSLPTVQFAFAYVITLYHMQLH